MTRKRVAVEMERSGRGTRSVGVALSLLVGLGLAACGDDGTGPGNRGGSGQLLEGVQCELNRGFLADGGVGRDGIPSIDDPVFVSAGAQGSASYLDDADRVIGLVVDVQAYAIPHRILWWHEIVNMEAGGEKLAVTLCPLTGTSLAFDRSSVGGDELGVSGLLFKNNLIMYNRGDPEGLFPQMLSEARCGEVTGQRLEQWPVVEMTWGGWQRVHPDTRVISNDTGFERNYQRYPYGNYEDLTNSSFFFPMPSVDRSRPAKERVLAVPPTATGDGIAFPYGALRNADGQAVVVEFTYEGEPAVLLWSAELEGGMAFRPRTRSGTALTLVASGNAFEDEETGTRWNVDGTTTSTGEHAGDSLEPLERTYVAFWGAWSAFHPDARLWTAADG